MYKQSIVLLEIKRKKKLIKYILKRRKQKLALWRFTFKKWCNLPWRECLTFLLVCSCILHVSKEPVTTDWRLKIKYTFSSFWQTAPFAHHATRETPLTSTYMYALQAMSIPYHKESIHLFLDAHLCSSCCWQWIKSHHTVNWVYYCSHLLQEVVINWYIYFYKLKSCNENPKEMHYNSLLVIHVFYPCTEKHYATLYVARKRDITYNFTNIMKIMVQLFF